jgi:hypothetical protein
LAQEFVEPLAWEQAQPTPGDLFVGPLGHDIGTGAQDDMHVIREDGIGQDIDPEDRGQAFQSSPDPFAAAFVILT